jgi:energy-coupling factor transporter ATP-binding protein EcfA2
MQLKLSFIKDPLVLPKRYEILERQIVKLGGEISKIIKKIDSACSHVENLLGKINVGGVGQFQLFLGESGSGKTTFLRTLPNFFDNIYLHSFNIQDSFEKILNEIENTSHINKHRIFVIDERDNPSINSDELKSFFEKLRILFRKKEGEVLLIWPITDKESAKKIGEIAWEVGKESISPIKGPIYNFEGLPKKLYYDVADDTVRNLNNGENLDSFGITQSTCEYLLKDCKTIGEFYTEIENLAIDLNDSKWKILQEKIKPKIWILLPGDSSIELDRTVKSLTSGIESKVDIDRMCSFLDDASNKSTYLNDWRKRRSDAGFLFRFLDVRLFYISPNLALSTARVYGSNEIKEVLNKKSEAKSICLDAMKRSDFYLALCSRTDSSKRSGKGTNQDTQHEYIRLQKHAKGNDKNLNKSFSKALEETLIEDGFNNFSITCEKQELKGTNLKPDILINMENDEVICLELTWRSTGIEVKDEIGSKQNTLTTGHIQKYILEKVMEYVKELNI